MPPTLTAPPPFVDPLLLEPPTVAAPPPPIVDPPPFPVAVPAAFPDTEPAVGRRLELVPAWPSAGESSGEHAPVASKTADER
jgi:hypothetical protein